MAGPGGSAYVNIVPGKEFTLNVLAKECGNNFPVVVTNLPPEYEFMFGNYLPPDEEVLFIRPELVPFVRVKILPFINEDDIARTKGSEFVEARNKFVGKEFLFPLGYPGMLQLLQKRGRRNRLTSMSQVIEDTPGFVQIYQTIQCESPIDGSLQTIPKDTILEIMAIKTLPSGNCRYFKCKSSDNKIFYLTEDCPVNGKALHRVTSIVEDMASLPKTVIFEPVDPNDVLLSDDDEANDMLVITGGPLALLSVDHRNVYVAWLQLEELNERRKLAVIPEEVWPTIRVTLLQFSTYVDRIKYMTKFGSHYEAEFIADSLYKMLPVKSGIVLLSEPRVENIDDYEKPVEPSLQPPSQEKDQIVDDEEDIKLPTHVKTKKASQFKKVKAFVGLSKGHPPVHGHSGGTHARSKEKRGETHEMFALPNKEDVRSQNNDQADAKIVYSIPEHHDRHIKDTKPQQAVRPIIALSTLPRSNPINDKSATLARLVDISKINQRGQRKEDFYKYTRDEVVECFKLCGLTTLAKKCSDNNLDGAFFRNINLTDLQTLFKLEPLEVRKVENAIENGWRPVLS